ncbi:ZF-HD homeobox protein [Macleaya cordata]|uniref:ZF-HD homeobox protein n=1 Tax=Macleaya cordata TaxID=56857 RepID=A0A200R914_MACCD|nr:ZF-HD homeobox protein [Macleaya cordata]
MNLSNEEREIPISNPIPITSTYAGVHGHGNMIHHNPTPKNHTIPSSATQHLNKNQHPYNKVVISYRECLKNHAAAMGGSVMDGCCEFMPGGEEGTLEALKCSACNCHRNFHRKEIEEGESSDHHPHLINKMGTNKAILAQHQVLGSEALGYPTPAIPSSRETPPPKKIMIRSYSMGSSLPSESDDQKEPPDDDRKFGTKTLPQVVKKRFRTKFTQEQKEKMLSFAEKVGWKMQKQEEALVQQICQEIGIRRRVLKVWMHNNKHNLSLFLFFCVLLSYVYW